MFRLPGDEAITPSSDVIEAAKENKVHEEEVAQVNDRDAIDWDFIKEQYEVYQIPASEVDNKKNQIRSLMQTYGLSEKNSWMRVCHAFMVRMNWTCATLAIL